MRLSIIAVTLLTVIGCASVSAQTNCDTNRADIEASQCAAENFKSANVLLLSIVNEMMEEPRFRSRKKQLQAAEDLWIEYRGAQCSFEAANSEDSAERRIKETQCATRLTKLHTQQLSLSMRCGGDDMGC